MQAEVKLKGNTQFTSMLISVDGNLFKEEK